VCRINRAPMQPGSFPSSYRLRSRDRLCLCVPSLLICRCAPTVASYCVLRICRSLINSGSGQSRVMGVAAGASGRLKAYSESISPERAASGLTMSAFGILLGDHLRLYAVSSSDSTSISRTRLGLFTLKFPMLTSWMRFLAGTCQLLMIDGHRNGID
jgi:hypothetical protein